MHLGTCDAAYRTVWVTSIACGGRHPLNLYLSPPYCTSLGITPATCTYVLRADLLGHPGLTFHRWPPQSDKIKGRWGECAEFLEASNPSSRPFGTHTTMTERTVRHLRGGERHCQKEQQSCAQCVRTEGLHLWKGRHLSRHLNVRHLFGICSPRVQNPRHQVRASPQACSWAPFLKDAINVVSSLVFQRD